MYIKVYMVYSKMTSVDSFSPNKSSDTSRCIFKKFDRLMTRGKLLDNDTQLFIFIISNPIMTQLHTRDPENRQQNRFSERRFSEKKSVTTG